MRRSCVDIALVLFGLATPLTLLTTPAAAHPHVLIEAKQAVLFDDAGQLVGLKVEWLFDDMYTIWALDGLDANKNGVFEPEELHPLAKDNVTNLKEVSYFTYVDASNKKVEYGEVTDYGITFDGANLILHMTLPFKAALNPRADRVSIRSYDPSFWIYIGLREKDPVSFAGKAPDGCGFQIKPPENDGEKAYVPDDIAMLPENANLGAQFADIISIVCPAPTAAAPGASG